MQTRFMTRVVVLGAVAALSLSACATNGGGPGGEAGSTDLVISTDLPLQGASATQSERHQQVDPALPRSGGQQGGEVQHQAQDLRRLDRGEGRLGRRGLRQERDRPRGQHERGRRDGHVQLRLRQDRGADAQPGQHRPDAHGVAREHQPRPDQDVGDRRAGQVLPDRHPQLRPRGRHRRLPGPGCGRLRCRTT